MKKALCTIGWGILSFVIAQMALAFVSGMIFFMLAASEIKSENLPRLIAMTGMVIALVISGIVILMGIRGRLPGTMVASSGLSQNPAKPDPKFDEQ